MFHAREGSGGFIIKIVLDIAGAFVAMFLGRALGLYAPGASPGFIMSVGGAILLLRVYRMMRKTAS
jgi:uncharacterized membrane protein YeaQ/YmgE (transglycosylase-associated protein family)